MEELNDNTELLLYSSATLYLLSGVTPPREYIELVADQFITTIKTTSVGRFTVFHLFLIMIAMADPKKYIFVYSYLFYVLFLHVYCVVMENQATRPSDIDRLFLSKLDQLLGSLYLKADGRSDHLSRGREC